ncbi:MAG: hypothetical protein JWM76_3723 [Pseudonocardiales bacterium]|nr:hypothetical protein [Pseudonocardiales bacterium]
MTRRLVLIRHAKAGVAELDHDRPLALRGRTDAGHVGTWLVEQGLEPDHAFVSTALRTRQTWERVAAAFVEAPDAQFDHRLYDNALDDLLEVIREADATALTVVVIGHNPSIQELVLYLDDSTGPAETAHRVAGKFPTSAVAVLEIEPDWSDVGIDAGPIVAYREPKDS